MKVSFPLLLIVMSINHFALPFSVGQALAIYTILQWQLLSDHCFCTGSKLVEVITNTGMRKMYHHKHDRIVYIQRRSTSNEILVDKHHRVDPLVGLVFANFASWLRIPFVIGRLRLLEYPTYYMVTLTHFGFILTQSQWIMGVFSEAVDTFSVLFMDGNFSLFVLQYIVWCGSNRMSLSQIKWPCIGQPLFDSWFLWKINWMQHLVAWI